MVTAICRQKDAQVGRRVRVARIQWRLRLPPPPAAVAAAATVVAVPVYAHHRRWDGLGSRRGVPCLASRGDEGGEGEGVIDKTMASESMYYTSCRSSSGGEEAGEENSIQYLQTTAKLCQTAGSCC